MLKNLDFNTEVQLESKNLQLKLAKGELQYTDDEIQFFIPCLVTKECLEWLNIIAENTCSAEDMDIVKKFLKETHDLREDNAKSLHETLITQILEKLGDA